MSSDLDSRNTQPAEKALLAALILFVFAGVYVLLARAPEEDPPPFPSGDNGGRPGGAALSGFELEPEGPLLRYNLFVSDSQARWRPDPESLLLEDADPYEEYALEVFEEMVTPPVPPPPPPPEPPLEPPPAPRRIEVRYAGVVHRLDGQRRALLDVRPNGSQMLLQVGDIFEGFRVEGIYREHLTLERDGDLIPLPLNTSETLEAP